MIKIEKNNLYDNFNRKLIDEKLISHNDCVSIKKIHPIKQNGEIIHHHIVTVEKSGEKYLIRTIKEKDYSCMVMNYLISLNNMSNQIYFPHALTSPFAIGDHTYIITRFLDGEDLESLIETLSNEELLEISNQLDDNLKLIHSVTYNKFSSGRQFTDNSFGQIMYDNIYKQFNYEHNIFARNIDVAKLLLAVKSILTHSEFSKPTLIHMDIKPANIILSPPKNVHLIDFELSRFADLDYEWTNILIKILHAYNNRFKQYVLTPIIEKHFLPLDKAMLIDKYKVYLLYLSVNKYIYCQKHKILCPKTIIDLASNLVKQLT